MDDSKFLQHLQHTEKISWYLFGSTGFWKINNTCCSLKEKQRLKTEPYGCSNESEWTLLTTRYFIGLKLSEWGESLEHFWKSIDFDWAEKEGERLNEWFSTTPDW